MNIKTGSQKSNMNINGSFTDKMLRNHSTRVSTDINAKSFMSQINQVQGLVYFQVF